MLLFVTHVAAAPGTGVGIVRERRSILVDVHDRLGEGLWRFLRQIVSDAALDRPMQILAREFLCVRTRLGTRRTVGITLVI
jgi:hypothetical protein